ncbi:MAG: hypothetical protein ACJAUG_003507 [Halioglobus sp.]
MLFGYALAVIAGFLLTAAKNWTGQQTLHRAPLAGLFFHRGSSDGYISLSLSQFSLSFLC